MQENARGLGLKPSPQVTPLIGAQQDLCGKERPCSGQGLGQKPSSTSGESIRLAATEAQIRRINR